MLRYLYQSSYHNLPIQGLRHSVYTELGLSHGAFWLGRPLPIGIYETRNRPKRYIRYPAHNASRVLPSRTGG